MNLAIQLLDFIIQQLPSVLIDKLWSHLAGATLPKLGQSYEADSESEDLDDTLSSMGDAIWFDGVDKRLIEAHAKKGLLKRRKLKQATNGAGANEQRGARPNKSSENGTAGTSKQKPMDPDLSKHMLRPGSGITDELALDCEMVECYGHKSVLARVSIVNLFGHPILDSYVEPPAPVTDYRTRYSGIRAADLEHAPSFDAVQTQVSRLIKNRVVVGHAIHNDFSALKLSHPQDKTRDTSHYYGRNYFLGKTPSLKKLSQSILGITIQKGEHDSVQDAQATMKLYVNVREKWIDGVMKSVQVCKQQKKKQKTKPTKKKVKAFFVETL